MVRLITVEGGAEVDTFVVGVVGDLGSGVCLSWRQYLTCTVMMSAGPYLYLVACDRVGQFAIELRSHVFEHCDRCLMELFAAEKLTCFIVADGSQDRGFCGQYVVEVVEEFRQILDETLQLILLVDHPFRFGRDAGARVAFDRHGADPLNQGLFVPQVGGRCGNVFSDVNVLHGLDGMLEARLDLLERLVGESLVRRTDVGARRFVVFGRCVQASCFSPSCETQV